MKGAWKKTSYETSFSNIKWWFWIDKIKFQTIQRDRIHVNIWCLERVTTFSHPHFFPTLNSNLDAAISGEHTVTLKNEHGINRLDYFTYCNSGSSHWEVSCQPNIHLFKVNNRNTRARCKTCWKLTINTPEQPHRLLRNVFVSNYVIRVIFC